MSIAKPDPIQDRRETERFQLNLNTGFKRQLPDSDPVETQEWVEALDGVVDSQGRERADFLMRRVLKRARQRQVGLPGLVQSRYINTISPEQEPPFPGNEEMEKRIRRIVRWNAVAMVLRGNNNFPASAVTCPRTPRPRASMRWASTTSSAARTTAARAIRSSTRATPRRACTRVRSSRAV
jgi:hypothetical protein